MIKQILFSTVLVLSVSCGKNEPLTQLGQGAESLAQGIGNVGEDIGQIPRILGHQFLGTDIDTEKRLKDAEKQLRDLRQIVMSNYSSVNNSLLNILLDLNKLEDDTGETKHAINEIISALDELEEKVNNIDLDNAEEIIELQSDISTIQSKLNCVASVDNGNDTSQVNRIINCFKN
jgi:methyl-accepting chemotaxis protein